MLKKTHEKRKICIFSHFGYPLYNKKCKAESFGGGAAVQLYLLSNAFTRCRDLDINIITGNYKCNKRKIEVLNGLKLYKVLPLKKTPLNIIKYIFILFFNLFRINPDIVIQRTADVPTGLCAFYCKLAKKKFIYSIANEPDVNGTAEKGFLGKIYKYGIDNAYYIIAQNNHQITQLKKHKKREISNIKVISSGYEITEIDEKNKNHILWVSRCRPWKRPELFLKLARVFPKENFVIICSKTSDEEYWRKIRKSALKISNVKFLDFIPFHQINRYFREAKIFINTSVFEGFPNTFIQALKNETPIISLNVNPDKFLTRKKIGFFCNDDFTKLEEYLRLLLNSNDLYESYSKNAYLYAKNNHDIRKISYEWIKLIKQIS